MARRFLVLRLLVLRNSLAEAPARAFLLMIGTLFGLMVSLPAAVFLAGAGQAPAEDALLGTTLICSMITVLWLVAPLLFGVDDALRPARFLLLPLTSRQLTTGLLAASVVTVPAVMTLLATSGTIVAGALHGFVPALTSALGLLIGFAVCLVSGRALTTASARLMASRKTRDATTFAGFLLAAGAWVAWMTLSERLADLSFDGWLPAARVLSWTPLAAPFTAWWEAANGHGVAALAKLLIGVATVLALQWWWSRSLTALLTGAAAPRRLRAADPLDRAGDLIPRRLRPIMPTGTAGAVVARMLRIWTRDTRYRIALISNLVLPVALAVAWRSAPVEVIGAFGGCAMGLGAANAFGYDGPAYATHLLAAVPGRLDLRARLIANACLAVPLGVVGAVAIGLVRGDVDSIVPTIATVLAGFGCAASVSMLLSARVPYVPAPPEKPFSAPPDGAGRQVIVGYGALLGGLVLSAPVLAMALFADKDHAPLMVWLVLPAGVIWGAVAAEIGVSLGGDLTDRRAPEILAAVTPRG